MRRTALLAALLTMVTFPLAAAQFEVTVGDDFFDPPSLTIQPGDTVTWSNTGRNQHNVTADDGSFRCATNCVGSGGSPSSAAWSFSLTFNEPGDIPYYCEEHGAPGGLFMAGKIIVEGEGGGEPPGEAFRVITPIAGSVLGQANAFFRTFLRIFNPSETETISVGGAYLKRGMDNRNAPEVVVMIAPREQKVFDDVIGSLFNDGDLGAIRWHSDNPFNVTSRIFTDSQCEEPNPGGTFGQFSPGTPEENALTSGVILHLSFTPEVRANIGGANPQTTSANIMLTLHGSGGVLGNRALPLNPRDSVAPTSLSFLFDLPNLNDPNLWVSFTSDQPVILYGVILDNTTQDQAFVPAFPLPLNAGKAEPGRTMPHHSSHGTN